MSEVEVADIVLLSLKVSAVAMLFAVPIAFAVAWVLARHEFWGKSLLQALVTLPLVMPPVVTGYFLLVLFGFSGFAGRAFRTVGLDFAFRWEGAALAAGVMAFPLLVRPMRLSIETLDRGLEEAAATLGAGRLMRLLTITLPLVMPGVIAGAVLGFAKALGEFGATITFVSNIPGETQTLSLAIYSLLQSPAGDRAMAMLIAISACLAIGSVLLSEWVGRHIGQRRRR
ncbi:molybdate ABC transporter permease subunit [Hoeflea poritis]|uniref:Molybdenum transport system permease n=1 Tax=Hoeflea poritis TaxID=2993659 RepID=A0ABT4VR77_9HYPH|nr:molybdate ABC transporter permease subunit [Hoeflea poritis]MDA4847220.1 molybdate ABC transporter permease subunit [Hoeflea poritis]